MASRLQHVTADPAALPEAVSHNQQTTALLKLRELLLCGEFRPGERLREIPLTKRLNVSRTPLRLALTAMQHEGLLDLHPKRGFIVRLITGRDVEHAIEIRGLLEGMASRLFLQRLIERDAATMSLLAALEAETSALDTAVSRLDDNAQDGLRAYIRHNTIFHSLLLDGARSEVLRREFDRISRLPFAAPGSGFLHRLADLPETRNILRIGQDQHHAILSAFAASDGYRLEALLREHARLSLRNLEIALASGSPGMLGIPIL